MASYFDSSTNKGCDFIYDFCCTACEENTHINTEAQFYCEQCSKCYCDDCVKHHNLLLKKHSVLGRQDVTKWKCAHKDALEQCQEHGDRKLEAFCEDHSELLCTVCHIYDHLKCSKVVLIADKMKAVHQVDFLQMADDFKSLQRKVNQERLEMETTMESLQDSYQNTLDSINFFYEKMYANLNQLKDNSIKELDILMATLKTSLQKDIDKSASLDNSMQNLKDKMQTRRKNVQDRSFIMYRKCLDLHSKVNSELKTLGDRTEAFAVFNPDVTIEWNLSGVSVLGKVVLTYPNKIIAIASKTQHSLNMKSDSDPSWVSGICETADGKLLITDRKNRKVKLLDQTFKVVAHCDLPCEPWCMSSIDSGHVAVAMGNNVIHFIRVTNGQLVQDRTLQLQHSCLGIAHLQGNLYITSGTALYHYTVDGRLVNKMYEDTSGGRTVACCTVSADGDRIYVANVSHNKLLTLSKGGRVLATMSNPAFKWEDIIQQDSTNTWFYNRPLVTFVASVPPGIHVTDSGQVLVCGGKSNKILQVDRNGRQILAEVVTEKDGIRNPTSVCYSELSNSLTVGMWHNSNILTFKTQ